MRKINLAAAFIVALTTLTLRAQEMAITERGDTVILYSNGSWVYYEDYLSGLDMDTAVITMNKTAYKKPATSLKKMDGSNKSYSIWYNDKVWKRVPVAELNPDADVAFKMINGDAYSMVVYEQLEIPEENLSKIALDNALNVAPDMRMVDREYRIVNGDTLIWMQMDGTVEGMKITYYSYYYSNKNYSIQFHTFTGQNLLNKYRKEMEDLLNGVINNVK